MARQPEERIRELHERLMRESLKQIDESIHVHDTRDIPEAAPPNISAPVPTIIKDEVSTPAQNEHSGPDKINDIRNEVAANQPAATLNPDRQSKLMEILKQRSEEFERESHTIGSADHNMIESAAQKFKNELLDNVRRQLAEDKYVLEH